MPVTAISPLRDCLPASHQTVNVCRVCLTWLLLDTFSIMTTHHAVTGGSRACAASITGFIFISLQHWIALTTSSMTCSEKPYNARLAWSSLATMCFHIRDIMDTERKSSIYCIRVYTGLRRMRRHAMATVSCQNVSSTSIFFTGLVIIWNMRWRAPDQEVDQRGRGKRLCRKIVKHVIWTRRMLWIVVDGRRW